MLERSLYILRLRLSTLLLLAFALRLIQLDFQPLWWDEGWTFYFSTLSLPDLVARTAVDIHPPFYYVLLKLWLLLAGVGPWQARLLSVFVGILTLPFLYLFARRLLPKPMSYTAFILAVVATFHVYYSQEVRMYGLLTLFSLAATYALLRIMHRPEQRAWWGGYVMCATAALYTEYYAALILCAHVLYAGLSMVRRQTQQTKWFRSATTAWVAVAVLYMPWIVYVLPKLQTYISGKVGVESYAPLAPQTFLVRHFAAWSVGYPPPAYTWLTWTAAVPFFLAVAGTYWLYTTSQPHPKKGRLFLLLYICAPLVLAYLINLWFPFHPLGFERLLLPVAPAYWMLVGVGTVALQRYSNRLALFAATALTVISLLSLNVFYTAPRYPNDDYRPVMARMQAQGRAGDVMLAVHPWQMGYARAYLPSTSPKIFAVPAKTWAANPQQRDRDLDRLLATHPRLWFPAYQVLGRMLENDVATSLAQRAYPITDKWYGNTRLYLFAGGPVPAVQPTDDNFGGRLRLIGIGQSKGPVQAAYGVVKLTLRWAVIKPPSGEVRIALRLTDAQGYTWAGRDSAPMNGVTSFSALRPGEIIEDHQGLLIPAGTPPGDYTIRLGLYRQADGQWLDRRDSAGQSKGIDRLVGQVHVIAPARMPPPEALPIEHPQAADLAEGLRFLGYTLPAGTYHPGEPFTLVLFWQAREDVSDDLRVFVQVLDDRGKVWGARDIPPVGGTYPTTRWTAGTLVRDPHPLTLDPATPDGTYHLIAGLYRPAGGKRLPILQGPGRGTGYLALQDIVVVGRPHRFSRPKDVGIPRDDRFGGWAQLMGLSCEPTPPDDCRLRSGDRYTLTLTWKSLGHTTTSHKVFLHLEDGKGRIWGQSDQVPGRGDFPTTGWVVGEYLRDRHTLTVRADIPAGTYHLVAGLYDDKTGQRVPVLDGAGRGIADHVLLQTITIR